MTLSKEQVLWMWPRLGFELRRREALRLIQTLDPLSSDTRYLFSTWHKFYRKARLPEQAYRHQVEALSREIAKCDLSTACTEIISSKHKD